MYDAQRRELLGLDRDKTPTLSAVSRLENKYSNILDRAAGRRRHEEDRDKTLEPDDYGAGGSSSGLLRSATTHQLGKPKLSSSSFNAGDRKERTPYRTRAQRQRYIADSSDSGYLTGGNHRLVDESYPLDYTNRYHPNDYHDALRAGGATGYPSSRYGRRDTNDDPVQSRSTRAYGGHTRTELDLDNDLTPRSRYTNRRREPAPPAELTAEEREILADDRSSEDNAAILLLLREDNQFLEAKKFEERMRKRRELRERVKKQEEAAVALAKKTEEAEVAAAIAAAAEAEAKERAADQAAKQVVQEPPQEAPKKKSRSKKVTNDSDSDSSTSTSESSSSDEAEVPPTGVQQLTKDTTDTAQAKHTSPAPPSLNGTTTSNNNNTNTNSTSLLPSSLSNLTLQDTTTAAATPTSSSSNKSRFLLHSDRNNNSSSNDLSKYKPGNILHSSSSGALAFGGIGARLAAADTRRQQQQQQLRYQGASSRTAAVLSEFDRYKPGMGGVGAGTGVGAGLGSSYLHDSYTSSNSSRRSNALGSSSIYQRHQLQQAPPSSHSSHYLQHDQYQLSKSATSSALFHRSRIPKTLSTFVSHTRCISLSLSICCCSFYFYLIYSFARARISFPFPHTTHTAIKHLSTLTAPAPVLPTCSLTAPQQCVPSAC